VEAAVAGLQATGRRLGKKAIVATGSQNTQQQQQSQSQSAPWQPTQQSLQSIIASLQGYNTTPSKLQTGAVNSLVKGAGGLPNFGGTATNAVNTLTGAIPGMLQNNQNTVNNALAPQLSANFTNPFTNPATQKMLDTINQQITNQVNGEFAGAGRDLSGANTKTLGMGLGMGEATPLFNEYNSLLSAQNNAASTIGNLGLGTAGAEGNSINAGLGAAGAQPGLALGPALAQLQAAMTKKNLPLSNLSGVENMLLPIAGLGGQTSGTASGQSNTQTNLSPFAMGLGAAGLFGGSNSAASNIGGGIQGILGKLFGPSMSWGG